MAYKSLIRGITNKMRPNAAIQYTSSLYVDSFEKSGGFHYVIPMAPVLVLNGAIGSYESKQLRYFLQHCSHNWDHVLYVPGPYEFGTSRIASEQGLDHLISDFMNVYLMANNSRYVRRINTYILGTPYCTDADVVWLRRAFDKVRSTDAHIVVASSAWPQMAPCGDVYPVADVWLHGGVAGGRKIQYMNGVLGAYNARGHIARVNDFSGKDGWSLTATIDLPNKFDETAGPLVLE
jgi:hypothetical protein